VASSSNSGSDSKRPYGGLVPSQPKGTRAYQDAATYNHQLAQHQAYTAQAQAAQANTTYRNPYVTQQQPTSQGAPPAYPIPQESTNPGFSQFPAAQPSAGHRGLTHQSSAGQLGVTSSVQYSNHSSGAGISVGTHLNPNPPSSSYYPSSRGRANTINQMDSVPPALARLQHMNQDVIAGRNALTPVLNRDDAMREWERRQAGKPTAAQPYPQLEYLQQQAELAAASGLTNWAQPTNPGRYPPPSKLARSFHPPNIVVDDDNRRDAVMSNVRNAARGDGPSMYASSTVISSPPQAYNSNATTSGNRFTTTYTQQQQTPASPFDSVDRRTDIGNLFVPMQPDAYQTYNASSSSGSSATHGMSSRHVAPPAQAVAPSFYGASVVQSGPPGAQRNPFSVTDASAKENRRGSGMELWPQR
jgi:dual specificity protein kinase YAK1